MVSMIPPAQSDVTYGNLTAQEFRLGLRYLIPDFWFAAGVDNGPAFAPARFIPR